MLRVRDIMTLDVVTTSPGATLREVAETLVAEAVSGLPVVAGEDVVGVVSATDVAAFAADTPGSPTERDFPEEPASPPDEEEAMGGEAEAGDDPAAAYFLAYWSDAGADVVDRLSNPTAPEWNVFEEHTADEIMTTRLSTVSPDATVRDAARYMLRHGVHRVLVMEDSHLVGVLSTTDIVKAVAQHGVAA